MCRLQTMVSKLRVILVIAEGFPKRPRREERLDALIA
jgi:hypothetical protein